MMRAAGLLLFVGLTVACGRKNATPPVDREPTPAGADASGVRHRRGGSDVTFAVVSDTHFGYGGMPEQNRALVAKVSTIEGRSYPAEIGGTVARPRGLLVTGDLTEWGRVEEWQPFVATYGLTGTEGALKIPVFEVIGNHDKVHGPWVEEQVAKRHGGRFYSWDWADLHLVGLGEAPDDEGLRFLASDLAKVGADVPVVLFFHLPLDGPYSTGHWFGDGDHRQRLAAAISKHHVVAIFHGHHHATGHYVWNGVDVFKPGAVKNDAHTVAFVRVTDDRFTLGSFRWDKDEWASAFAKPLRAK